MSDALSFITGGVVGSALAALIARWMVRRVIRRNRAAERRARDAERLADLGAMTSGLAHEIKNPLSTIGLNAQLLGEAVDESGLDGESRGRLSRRIASLRREVERLKGILSDFLQYAGELRLQPGPADLNQVVDELVDFFLPQAEHHGVRLRADLTGGTVWAEIDVPLIKQAVLNLMLNAVQAMAGPFSADESAAGRHPSNVGELILRTHTGRDTDGSATVILHVIDTGPGIPAEALAKIFQPYFTTKSGGTGLGLPTTRRLIEAHGGRIDVFTQPGKGTDFMVVLPAASPPAAQTSTPMSGAAAESNSAAAGSVDARSPS